MKEQCYEDLVHLLKAMTHECMVVQLPGGCTLDTVPKIYMDEARKFFAVPDPEPIQFDEVNVDSSEGPTCQIEGCDHKATHFRASVGECAQSLCNEHYP